MAKENTTVKLGLSKKEMLRQYHHVVDSAELVSISLIKSQFEVKPNFFSSEKARQNIGFDIDVSELDFSEEKGAVMAFLNASVESRIGKKRELLFRADYIVFYGGLVGASPEAVDAFVKRVAPFACYPYFRALFANHDWAANTRLPPLPVLREPVKLDTGEMTR
ncbi:hypothetical protein ASD50_13815 [Mesorhizobium sp. Root552]|uniref:hypothetical protein n=1 Tax=Mesorhizobium sp. Root552 TaxID=1736555 RepID=UPI0006FC294C|nr:hypothetical protein [Mesorhizobium sp. Root552]KQZ32163.1 hypothetical protein ASD50_13815 [Mesorhizobium sp. Root552]